MNKELLKKIEQLQLKIESNRPFTSGELKELRKWYDVTFTYNSNAIEGNTLTLAETKVVIEDGLTIGGKQVKEILEAKNHKKVLDTLFSLVHEKKELSEDLLCELHRELLFDIEEEDAGKYRKIQVFISGTDEKLPMAKDVPKLMVEFFKWLEDVKDSMNPVELAVLVHYKFVKIHPFIDGNGRVARLILNLILMGKGYPPIVVPVVLRLEYIQSFVSEEKFMNFMLSVVHENLKDYTRMFGL